MTILLTELPDNYEQSIKSQLLTRFGLSSAEYSIKLIHHLPHSDLGYSIHHLKAPIVTDYWGIRDNSVIHIDDVEDISTMADIIASQYIKPHITWTDDLTIAAKWLAGIESKYPMIAVDFESKDLTLPQFNKLTMVTVGWHRTKSVVIVFKDQAIQDYVLNWLVTTECKQVYHNA
jgi:hypothetical protein